MIIYKFQGLIFDKCWIDLGVLERVVGFIYVVLLRVCKIFDFVIELVIFDRFYFLKKC